MEYCYTQKQALEKFRTKCNIFLTGEPGTGKSYIINQYIEECKNKGKQVLVCAPTGIAALNVNGVTMHQAFSIPIPAYGHYITEITDSKVKAALTADIIIIDEISMCRNDVFEYFGYVMDYIHKKKHFPQVIVCGDFFQLPPVVQEDEKNRMKRLGFDPSGYCFTSRYWTKLKLEPVVLTKIMRQDDPLFIKNLGLLRVGNPECIAYFSKRVGVDYPDDAIQICSTNARVQEINDLSLNQLDGPKCLYKAKREKFCGKDYPAEDILILKEGAKIMFVANDVISGTYHNGELGVVTLCLDNYIRVKKSDGTEIDVYPYKWRNYNVKVSDGAVLKNEVGVYSQIPVKLAYAVTMHKTQGQTYDKAIIAPNSFADGQLYVAVSRVTSIDGLVFSGIITANDIKASSMVSDFYRTFCYNSPQKMIEKRQELDKKALEKLKKAKKQNTKRARNTVKKKTTKKKSSKTSSVKSGKPSTVKSKRAKKATTKSAKKAKTAKR